MIRFISFFLTVIIASTASADGGMLRIWQSTPIWQGTGGVCAVDFGMLADGFSAELKDLTIAISILDEKNNLLGRSHLYLRESIGGSRANRYKLVKFFDSSKDWEGEDDGVPQPLCRDAIQLQIDSAITAQGDRSVDLVKTNQIEIWAFDKINMVIND